MGAWGAGSFENDDALDFLADFEDRPSVARIEAALDAATSLDADDYLESHECCVALAAAELVAAAKRAPPEGQEFEPATAAFLEQEMNATELARLAAQALAAVDRIANDSELKELWDDPDVEEQARAQWEIAVADLRTRLSAA
jgi:hypothetical protein